MDLEFQESDIIFSSDKSTHEVDGDCTVPNLDMMSFRKGSGKSKKSPNKKTKKKMIIHTVAVDIPCNLFHQRWEPGNRSTIHGHELYDYDDEEMVPPHVIVGRRIAEKMAFSVCSGIGRTLKGRDLSEVRNSILKLTGFLES